MIVKSFLTTVFVLDAVSKELSYLCCTIKTGT
jgi:hypothetical protein